MDYKTRRWQKKRQSILARDRYQCRQCRRYGLAVPATVVHHAWPAEDYPEFAWEDWNLVSLCAGCHGAMHDRDSDALTELGLSWRRRVAPLLLPPAENPLGDRGAGLFPTAGKTGRGVNRGTKQRTGM